ncbi:MAG: hypothetical protein K8I82_17905, partial [Anaerolineae bacterium]|nr:hypothetical protein [Anaerolineae bacterium]
LTPNMRNGASVIESLITAKPPQEWLTALVALGTSIEHAGNLPDSEESQLWQQPLDEFIHYLYQHGHIYDGIIVRLRIPPQAANVITGTAFVARTPADHPIVNAAVAITPAADGSVEKAIAVLGGASEEPITKLTLMPLEGKSLNDATIAAAVAYIESHVIPVSDYQGSLEYRQQMAHVCVRRALEACLGK